MKFLNKNGGLTTVCWKCNTTCKSENMKRWSEPFNYPIFLGSHTKLLNSFCWTFKKNYSRIIIFENEDWPTFFPSLRRSRILFPMPCCSFLRGAKVYEKIRRGQSWSFSFIRGQFLILSQFTWRFSFKGFGVKIQINSVVCIFSAPSKLWPNPHCLKITQNVAFEFLSFGIFHHFLSYKNWPVW